jgi:hypothetical protein
MSSLMCEIWLPNPVDGEAVQRIASLIQQIGTDTSASENLWKDKQGSEPI